MPIQRKLEEAVPILLRHIADVEPILVRLNDIVEPILGPVDKVIERLETGDSAPRDSNHERHLGLLKKIKELFDNQKKDSLQEPKRTGDKLLKSLTDLEKEIDDFYFSTDAGKSMSIKDEGLPHKLLRLVVVVDKVDFNEEFEKDLGQLGEIKNHLALLKQIEDFFDQKNTDLFHDLKRKEDELLKNFTALEEHIDDSKYSIGQSIANKFKSLQDVVSEFKDLKFEKSKEGHKNSESEAPAREISEKWRELKVEQKILESPAISCLRSNYEDIADHKMLIAAKDIEHHKILTHPKDTAESKEYKGYKEHTIRACNIKLCLLCFSVFPANSVIEKRPLIYWWLGEGLIGDTEEGERIFSELIRKGFLTAQYKRPKEGQHKNPTVDSVTMHPWNLRMLISAAKGAEFFDFEDDTGLPADHGTRSRRRCLVKRPNRYEQNPGNGDAQQQNNTRSTTTMVTLFNVNEQYLNIDHKWFSEQNKLVVLQLGRWQDSAEYHIEVENEEFLKALGTKRHLKYLSLRGISRITAIPSPIRKLVNLEILDLRACHNLEKLPSDISYLKKLKHLDISECYMLEGMPKGLEKLTSLQVLKGFVVTTSKQSPCKLENLASKLNQLRKLSIYIRNEDHKEDLAQLKDLNELNKFKSVRILSITWGGAQDSKTEKKTSTEKTSTSPMPVSLPPELKKLDLWCIPEESPSWLKPDKLQSLRKLYIRGGKLKEFQASSSTDRWKVQILRLKYLRVSKEKEPQLRQRFPYLVYLEIEEAKDKDERGASSSSSSRSRTTD